MKTVFDKLKPDDFFKNADFHIHSTHSDGNLSFTDLIYEAKSAGLKYFSITDHNTLEGYKNLKSFPQGLISGVEFDCFFDFNLPHILGYGVDVNNDKINELASGFKSGYFGLAHRIFNSKDPKTVIDTIHAAGGIASLAHPCCNWCINLDKFVKKLVSMGLDGIEVYYPYNRSYRCLKFHHEKLAIKLAKKYSLIKTGGTDTHNSLIS